MMGIPALFIPWIRVNEQGRRFVNEEVPVSMLGGAIINQTHGRCWTVLDANYPQAAAQLKTAYLSNDPTIADGSVAVIGQMIEEGALIQADTVEELAEKMGVDAATLKETFERTTRDAASGVDTRCSRRSSSIRSIRRRSTLSTRARRCSARVAACIPTRSPELSRPREMSFPVSRLANAPVVCGLAVCTPIMSMAVIGLLPSRSPIWLFRIF